MMLFVRHEGKAKAPLLDMELVRRPAFIAANQLELPLRRARCSACSHHALLRDGGLRHVAGRKRRPAEHRARSR